MRIGFGYDVHRLVSGRPLILGGVEIPYHLGLEGHSDADVLAHAVGEALLGALGAGDLGAHFPDTDAAYRNISSLLLLECIMSMVKDQGWRVVNVDATVVAQAPRLAPYISQMRARLAPILGVAPAQVNVKATTTEHLGFTGRREGIAAYAVALLGKQEAQAD